MDKGELKSSTINYPNGDVYTGNINYAENKLPDGEGMMLYSNGDFDKGLWKEGKFIKGTICRTIHNIKYNIIKVSDTIIGYKIPK